MIVWIVLSVGCWIVPTVDERITLVGPLDHPFTWFERQFIGIAGTSRELSRARQK